MNKAVANKFQQMFAGIVFSSVRHVELRPQHISEIIRNGRTYNLFDQEFQQMCFRIRPGDKVSYDNYSGLVTSNTGSEIVFWKAGFVQPSQNVINCQLTPRVAEIPPHIGEAVMGVVNANNKKLFKQWLPVHPGYKHFIGMCLNPETHVKDRKLTLSTLRLLTVSRKEHKHDQYSYYELMALLLLFEDYAELVRIHQENPKRKIDEMIFNLTQKIGIREPWFEFQNLCIKHNVPSKFIPARSYTSALIHRN